MFTRFMQIIKRLINKIYTPKNETSLAYDNLMSEISTAWLKPPPDFDEQRYLSENQDVRAFVRQGRFASGFDHYMKHGRHEGRRRPIKHL